LGKGRRGWCWGFKGWRLGFWGWGLDLNGPYLDLDLIIKADKQKKYWKKVKPKAFKNDLLMKLLMKLQNPQDMEKTINDYWINIWKETESQRYSQFSAQAYQTLRKILKYHLFEKTDEGIINCIRKDDDSIEDQPEKVNELLVKTMKEIQIDDNWEFYFL